MARLSRLQSISICLVNSRGATRLLASSASSFSTLPSNHCKTPDFAAACPSSPSLHVQSFAGVATCSSPSFTRARFVRSLIPRDFVAFSRGPFSYGISSSPSFHGMARTFFSGSRGKMPEASSVPPPPAPADPPQEDMQVFPKELMDAVNNTVTTLRESATSSIAWIHESLDNLLLVLRERFDLPEYAPDTVTQLLYTTTAAALAWLVMPRILRMFHRYFEDGSHLILRRSEKIPYEASFWSALEDPAKIFISLVAFSQLSSLIAPTTIASQYLHQIWKGTALVALVWFLQRWKTNVLSRMLADQNLGTVERERILTLEKISSMGLFILGGMGVAETCGIAAHSILTVGGVGGVATAFAARDILGNMLSGISLQFMKPFSIGDTIKAGSIEGQVLDIGLTSTQLLDLDKFPVAVPNSFFSSQVIVNKSRATWRAFSVKVPVQLNDFEKVPQITQEVRNMLKSHPKVTLQNGVPLCYASRVIGTSLEITILCNLIFKGKEDLLSSEQDITLQTLKIISNAGATFTAPV
eukprot:c19032_g1_i1 orf=79-1659(+)